VRIEHKFIEFFDLFLDVMIDASGAVTEKDEYQLVFLSEDMRDFTRRARDEVRGLIAERDPLFDPLGTYFTRPEDTTTLPPATDTLELG
jgi:hypothetical protein